VLAHQIRTPACFRDFQNFANRKFKESSINDDVNTKNYTLWRRSTFISTPTLSRRSLVEMKNEQRSDVKGNARERVRTHDHGEATKGHSKPNRQ
jgi:hypothetical protein